MRGVLLGDCVSMTLPKYIEVDYHVIQGTILLWMFNIFSSNQIEHRTRGRKGLRLNWSNRYQSSNNGKFPSLNLTHKEVGGSFYTVREIVRDIIQENKVLGPGNPSSKLLNLEYYSNEEEDKGLFLNVQGNISVSTVVNGKDQVLHEVVSSMEDQEISIDQDNTLIKSVLFSKAYLNENSSWLVPQAELNFAENFSNGIVLHDEVIKTVAKESSGHLLAEKKDDASFIETELKNEDTHTKISVTRQCLEDGTNISEPASTDSIPETNLFFSDGADDQSKFCPKHDKDGVFPLVAHTFGEDSSSEAPVLLVSDTSQIFESGQKAHLMAEPYEYGVAIDKSDLEPAGLNSINSTFRMSEISVIVNNGVIPFIPFEKEYIASDAHHGDIASFSENNVDVAQCRSVDNLELQAISPCAPGSAENDAHMVDKFSSFVDAITESESVSDKFLKPIIQVADHTKIKVEKLSDAASAVNDGGFIREPLSILEAPYAVRSYLGMFSLLGFLAEEGTLEDPSSKF
ncbi:hypothetical protein KSP39_PZI007410 [Platanthera zijinensis]|uniref:AT3G52170-like helix-turn-helix domain-containing protein n=1 Tax=Platanthera zijinensis TaxID=2320716 RepID=A0AAP0G9X5_9ASPA